MTVLPQASNGQWYQMNDSMVHSSNIKVVLNQQAYVLFYLRWGGWKLQGKWVWPLPHWIMDLFGRFPHHRIPESKKNVDSQSVKQGIHAVKNSLSSEQIKRSNLNGPLSSPQVTKVPLRSWLVYVCSLGISCQKL